MPRSTLILGFCCFALLAVTVFVGWRLYQPSSLRGSQQMVQGANLDLGLPEILSGPTNRTFSAGNVLLYDAAQERILFEQRGFERTPIASITKLMTAMVAIDYGIDLNQEANILASEYGLGGNLLLHKGETVRMGDLLAASLVGSANNATKAYVRQLGVPEEEFIRQMNRKAIMLGLEQTEFVGVTGLKVGNTSTAFEVAKMATAAWQDYPMILELSSAHEYPLTVLGSGRSHVIRHTNKLVTPTARTFSSSKTGYLDEAGFCLVAQGDAALGSLISVVLNAPSEQVQYLETQRLFAER